MRKWEDIIKDKLEEIDDALPDSVFAEFQKRRDNASPAAAPVRGRSPLVWAIVPAVAAGLAAVFFLRPANTFEEGVQVLDKPGETVAQTVDPVAINSTAIRSDIDGSTNSTVEIKEIVKESPVSVAANNDEPGRNDESALNDEPGKNDESALNDEREKQDEPSVETPVVPAGSPYIPEKAASKRVKILVPATGVVAGGGLIAALAAPLVRNGSFADADDINYLNNKSYADKSAFAPLDKDDPTSQVPADPLTGSKHGFPMKVGLSVGIPVARRLNVTTGVDYSRYASKFTYSHSGDKTQVAQYVGIPVRLDWPFASMKWLDAYVGAGVEGDICVGATFAGRRIRKDGLIFSLLGAGGLQFNVTRHIGLYVEPQLSWAIPSDAQVLDTYRNSRPLMFSAAGGVRILLD